MKKSMLNVITLALVLINLVLTVLLTFSLVSTNNKTNNLITNLELSNPVHNNTHAHTLTTTTKPGKSKYKNVSIRYDKRHSNPKPLYVASIKINSKGHYIGSFTDEVEAAKAVDSYLDKIGDTLRIRNFP